MRKLALMLALAAAATTMMAEPGLAKKREIDLREADPWFGPAVRPPVSPQQQVIYGRTFSEKRPTAYERMMNPLD